MTTIRLRVRRRKVVTVASGNCQHTATNTRGVCSPRQVEEKVEELRELLPGERVAGVVSLSPDLLLNDVQTCLRPRMTRLVAALTAVKGFQGTMDADKVVFHCKSRCYARYICACVSVLPATSGGGRLCDGWKIWCLAPLSKCLC